MHCKTCHYSLANLTGPPHRCPECGNAFDPSDPSTFEGPRTLMSILLTPSFYVLAVFAAFVSFLAAGFLVRPWMRALGPGTFDLVWSCTALIIWPITFVIMRTMCRLAYSVHLTRWR